MIHVDTRAGSEQLIGLLRKLGLAVTPARLPFGDLKLLGSGPGGEPVTVGVEVKGVHDLLRCITDGRFAGHQLPGLVTTYDQPWLLAVGQTRCASSGLLQYLGRDYRWRDAALGSRQFMYRDLHSWLLTCVTKTGVLLMQVPDYAHVATWVASLYSWWTRYKRLGGQDCFGWDTHVSHLAINQASNEQFWARAKREQKDARRAAGQNEELSPLRRRLHDPANLLRPSVCRLVAAQLPGVGYARSEAVAKRFPTVELLTGASVKELMEVEGLGKVGAQKVWKAIHA